MYMSEKFYKVRDMSTGMWLEGGGRWGKRGKVWRRLCDLKRVLKWSVLYYEGGLSPFWEVVELNTVEGDRYPATALVTK